MRSLRRKHLTLSLLSVKATAASSGGKVGTVCCAAKAACEYKAMDVYFMQTGEDLRDILCHPILLESSTISSLFVNVQYPAQLLRP